MRSARIPPRAGITISVPTKRAIIKLRPERLGATAKDICMKHTTLEECQREIDRLRDHEPDFDELYVDAIDPLSSKIVERFFCKFRPPFRARVQDYDLLHQGSDQVQQKWRYRFVIPDDESTLVKQFHIFMSENAKKGMKLDPSLSYSKHWDKQRDAELRCQAEQAADDDAA